MLQYPVFLAMLYAWKQEHASNVEKSNFQTISTEVRDGWTGSRQSARPVFLPKKKAGMFRIPAQLVKRLADSSGVLAASKLKKLLWSSLTELKHRQMGFTMNAELAVLRSVQRIRDVRKRVGKNVKQTDSWIQSRHGESVFAKKCWMPMVADVFAAAKRLSSSLLSIISAVAQNKTILGHQRQGLLFTATSRNWVGRRTYIDCYA